jgi:biotin operon repressor
MKNFDKLAKAMSPHTEFRSNETINFINNNISLGKSEYKLMLQLIGQANNCNGVSFPSGEYLAKTMEVSRPRIMQIIKKLKEKGVLLVEKIRQGESFHNFYIIPTIEHLENVVLGTFNEMIKTTAANIKSAMGQVADKASDVVETVQEVVSKVKKVINKFAPKPTEGTTEGTKPSYEKKGAYNNKKKPIRTEMLPSWFEKAEEEQRQRDEARKAEQEAYKTWTPEEREAHKRETLELLASLRK